MAFLRPHTGDDRTFSRSAYGLPRLHQAVDAVVLILCNHKSAVAKGFRIVFGFELGTDVFIKQWIKGWKIELPPRPRHDPDEEGWDVGSIVQYSCTRPDNNELDTVELG